MRYKILPLPMLTNNTLEKKIELIVEHDLVIFSRAKDKVFIGNTEFLNTCHKSYDENIICPNFPLFSMVGNARKTCKVNLIGNSNSSHCRFTHMDRHYIKLLTINNAVVVSTVPHEKVKLYCKDKEARPRHLGNKNTSVYNKNPSFQIPLSGIAVFPTTCKIVSNNLEYNPLLKKTMAMDFFLSNNLE